jgi:hypothetical protein
VKFYEQTKIIYHGLSQPLATISFKDYAGRIGEYGYVVAHSNLVPTSALPATRIYTGPSGFLARPVSGSRQCYVYECVLSQSP